MVQSISKTRCVVRRLRDERNHRAPCRMPATDSSRSPPRASRCTRRRTSTIRRTRRAPASSATSWVSTIRTATRRFTTRWSHGAGLSMRYMLVDGQGNFGSVDGDCLRRCVTPKSACSVLPRKCWPTSKRKPSIWFELRRFPEGTGRTSVTHPEPAYQRLVRHRVGMSTNIPPHNLGEIIDGTIALIRDPIWSPIDGIHTAPDFPTGGFILARAASGRIRPAAEPSRCRPAPRSRAIARAKSP